MIAGILNGRPSGCDLLNTLASWVTRHLALLACRLVMTLFRSLLFLLSLALLSASAPSLAASQVAAEALFDEARRLLEEQKYDEACAKFAESQKLDPAAGTLLNLARCYELAGKRATAWATWKEAAASARASGQTDREAYARERVDALRDDVAWVTISTSAPEIPQGFTVTFGGEELKPALLGVAVPRDAGTYRLEASAPGYAPYATEVVVADMDRKELAIPPLEAAKAVSKVAYQETAPPSPQPWRKPIAWGGIAVGGAGIALGAVMAILAADARSGLDCPNGDCQPGVDAADVSAFRTLRTVSSVGFIAGGVLAAGGLTLLLTSPKQQEVAAVRPYLSPMGGGIVGRF